MSEMFYDQRARSALAGRISDPVEFVVVVHPVPGARRKRFGRDLASRLKANNYLVLGAAQVHLVTLGGRDAMTPKDVLGAWPRAQVRVTARDAVRESYGETTGHLEYRVHCLHLVGPELDLEVDLRRDPWLFVEDLAFLDEDDPSAQEAIAGLREEQAATETALHHLLRALPAA